MLGVCGSRLDFVISENLDGEGGTMEVMSPGSEGTDDSKELMIVDVVILYHQREGLRKV